MTDGHMRTRTHRDRRAARRRDRAGAVAVIALAGVAGLAAAHFGTHQQWEKQHTGTTTQTSTHVQGSP